MHEYYPSKLLERAVQEMSKLPGIGKRTALRLALHILKQNADYARQIGTAIIDLKNDIVYCHTCFNISDTDLCPICANTSRDRSLICVVESMRDIMAIENTQQFRGVYHVLGGVISPMDGIGPSVLTIKELIARIELGEASEIILALPPTMEGDTTNYYLYKQLHRFGIRISAIARGISIGDELEFADEVTLGRSILERKEFTGIQTPKPH